MSSHEDILHLPLLTYYLIHVNTRNKTLVEIRSNDVRTQVSDLKICLRNNTYNLHIIEPDLAQITFSYNITAKQIHCAVGLTLSAWTHNEQYVYT